MATGGTIATGGIAAEVLQQEGRLGGDVALRQLQRFDESGARDRVKAVAALPAADAIAQLKAWLLSVLQNPEAQQAALARPRTDQAPSVDDPASTAPPGPTELTASDPVAPGVAPAVAVTVPGPVPVAVADPLAPGASTANPVPDAPPSPTGPTTPPATGAPGNPSGARPVTRPVRPPWAPEPGRLRDRHGTGPVHPLDVIETMSADPRYAGFPNFWDAFAVYRMDHPQLRFTLSPINMLHWARRESPAELRIMGPDDWPDWETFKHDHPEFVFDVDRPRSDRDPPTDRTPVTPPKSPPPWASDVDRLRRRPSAGPVHPLDVIGAMAQDRTYAGYTNFWDAFAVYRMDHPQLRFTLSPINMLHWARGEPPTRLRIMGPEDWPDWESFKQDHPEFVYR
jgi:hypothetical protein